MKHLSDASQALFAALLAEAQLDVSPARQRRVLEHLDWVLEQNQFVNLTAITDPAAAIRLHAVDSLLAMPELAACPDGEMCDVGTGGGFPGIPLALATDRRTLLVDSVGKKCEALRGFILECGLGDLIGTHCGRAEDLALQRAGEFAVVTMRAVSALPSLLELASPLLRPSGRLICLKGPIDSDELQRGERAGALVGMHVIGSRVVVLPQGGETRTILVFERTGRTAVSLPRRVGLAQRKPLA